MGMGRSNACFKIIACGSDSAEKQRDDQHFYESKSSTDKRGWSFRKRSAHRVLSNNVNAETPPLGNKESPESLNNNFQPSSASSIEEKISIIQAAGDKSQLPAPTKATIDVIAATKVETDADIKLDSSVIIIQAAIRRFLAQRELLKLNNIVKVQAAVRGHLVRRHAAGTLRCVQSIVKMQALVRARNARSSRQPDNELDEKNMIPSIGMHEEQVKNSANYISIEKLLSNRFARQLMDSTPKTKPILINCDSSKENSGWNWLERWMSVASTTQTPSKLESKTEEVKLHKDGKYSLPCENTFPSHEFNEPVYQNSSASNTVLLPSEIQQTSAFSIHDIVENPILDNSIESDVSVQSDASNIESESKFLHSNLETEIQQPKSSMKRNASEQLETEGKKITSQSRKVSNPAFTAVQSKFEKLSSSANLDRSTSSLQQEVRIESSTDTLLPAQETLTSRKDNSVVENAPNNLTVQFGGSECGTELSISSTLDSPDRFELEAEEDEKEKEAKASKKEICDTSNLAIESNDASRVSVSNVSQLVDCPEEVVDKNPEKSFPDFLEVVDSELDCQAYISSPEASPKNHLTGTPSSQVDLKAKKKRTNKSGSGQKTKSPVVAKRSPSSNPNHAKNVTEQPPKDQKNGKRRNSFGITKPDNVDQEPRDSSSSSNSLPRFMQVTESARAKLTANNSPRSSPDVHDRDYIKKRHSLPGASERQGSPRIERSTSQAQTEKKWQR